MGMKEWQINSVICYVKAYNEASSFGGGLYVTENKKFVGDAFGPMSPGRYTPIEDYYKKVPFTIKINEFFKYLLKKLW